MSEGPILRVERLSKDFGGLRALDRVSLDLAPGESLGVIGPNGSGKTTLVNLVTGYLSPSEGQVLLRGRRITGAPPHRIARLGVGRTFQMARPFHHLPAFKNLVVPLTSPRVRSRRGGRYGDRDAVALDLLEEVGFERDSAVPYRPASVLPHGYVKRLELAQCLALEPDVLVLDELFSGLSLAEVAGLVPVIQRLQAEGRAIVMVEHRLRELFRIVDRVVVLNFGQVIADGTPAAVMESGDVRKAYLGAE